MGFHGIPFGSVFQKKKITETRNKQFSRETPKKHLLQEGARDPSYKVGK